MSELSAGGVRAEVCSAPAVQQVAIEEETPAPRDERASSEVVAAEEPAHVLVESAAAENAIGIDPPVVPMSDRVVRLLAKKAERKARKAQGCLKQASENSQHPVEVVTDIAPVCSDKDATSEEFPLGLLDVPIVPMLVPECRLASEDDVSPKTDEEEPLVCFKAEMDVSSAELSTSDEVLVGLSQSEESAEESLGENPDLDEHRDFDVPSVEASVFQPLEDACCRPHQAVWTCDEEFHGLYQPVQYDDAWMAPLEQVMRSRDEAECVYRQLFDDMCMGTGVGPEVHYQPVMCENNQQLYTDGEQFYMLACVDVSEDAGVTAPHSMQPVLDAHDPLHAEFSNELYQDSIQLLVCH